MADTMDFGGRSARGTGAHVTQEEYSAVCPYLGLADDADSHATYATEAHRCYRLPNPTRIATPHQEKHCLGANHVTCPVYLGEGVPARPAAGAAPAPAPANTSQAPAGTTEAPVRAPRAGQKQRSQGESRPKRPANAGTLGPRPRTGGISMPVMTAGLFALALVIVAIAFAIQNLVDDGDDGGLSPADTVATAAAVDKTRTAQAAGGQPTQPANGTQAPGGSQTATGSRTPGTAGPTATGTRTSGTGTPGAGGKTYVVKSGDFCGTIAEANGVSLAALLQANNMTEADCATLQIGKELKIP